MASVADRGCASRCESQSAVLGEEEGEDRDRLSLNCRSQRKLGMVESAAEHSTFAPTFVPIGMTAVSVSLPSQPRDRIPAHATPPIHRPASDSHGCSVIWHPETLGRVALSGHRVTPHPGHRWPGCPHHQIPGTRNQRGAQGA